MSLRVHRSGPALSQLSAGPTAPPPRSLGNVDWRMAGLLALGTAVGSAAGSNLAVQAPPGYLEAAFVVGMLFLGRKMLASAR